MMLAWQQAIRRTCSPSSGDLRLPYCRRGTGALKPGSSSSSCTGAEASSSSLVVKPQVLQYSLLDVNTTCRKSCHCCQAGRCGSTPTTADWLGKALTRSVASSDSTTFAMTLCAASALARLGRGPRDSTGPVYNVCKAYFTDTIGLFCYHRRATEPVTSQLESAPVRRKGIGRLARAGLAGFATVLRCCAASCDGDGMAFEGAAALAPTAGLTAASGDMATAAGAGAAAVAVISVALAATEGDGNS